MVSGIDVLNSVNAGDDPNALEVDGVKLSVSPLLCLAGTNAVLLQERYYFRFRFQFFRVQAFPNPYAIDHGIAIRSAVRSVNALSVVKTLVVVVMAFRAGLQRRVHGPEILTSMFRVAVGARDACLMMCGNDGWGEAFGLMTSGTVCVHL